MIEPNAIIKSRRKTLSITITKSGEVIVKSPIGLPMQEINKFLLSKQRWMEHKLASINNSLISNKSVIAYQKILLYGEKYELYKSASVKKLIFQDGKFIVNSLIEDNKKIIKLIKDWFKNLAESVLEERLKFLAAKLSIEVSKCKIKDNKARWGACTINKEIFLNYRLLMLPPALIDYVLIHELCHTKEMNHSSRFYTLVGMVLPNYLELKKQLKCYAFLLALYN